MAFSLVSLVLLLPFLMVLDRNKATPFRRRRRGRVAGSLKPLDVPSSSDSSDAEPSSDDYRPENTAEIDVQALAHCLDVIEARIEQAILAALETANEAARCEASPSSPPVAPATSMSKAPSDSELATLDQEIDNFPPIRAEEDTGASRLKESRKVAEEEKKEEAGEVEEGQVDDDAEEGRRVRPLAPT